MIVKDTPDGALLAVRITPKAKKNAIGPEHDCALKVSVTVVPEKGKANAALIKLLAKQLRIAKSDIEIVSGHTDRNKTLLLRGLSADDAMAKLLA